jgi:hypothetical protein
LHGSLERAGSILENRFPCTSRKRALPEKWIPGRGLMVALVRKRPSNGIFSLRQRGVYYYGLRQECSEKWKNGPWPSFIDLKGGTGLLSPEIVRPAESEPPLSGSRVARNVCPSQNLELA